MHCSSKWIPFAFLLEAFVGVSVEAEFDGPHGAPVCTEESGCDVSGVHAQALLQSNSKMGTSLLNEESVADDESETTSLVDSQTATARERQRTKLTVERDLSKLHASYYRAWNTAEGCEANAENAFDHLMDKLGENDESMAEMTEEEKRHFKVRFVSEMKHDCKVDPEIIAHWVDDLAAASEHEKPAMTAALADSINAAGLGFKVKMQEWLLTESANSFSLRRGKERDPAENTTMFLQTQKHLADYAASGKRASVPSSFNSATQWPECADVIKRAHNQGVCGSCWAFGAAGCLDSRLCIATGGQFQAQVSRGYTTSCGKSSGDGCQGGLARYLYDLRGGVPTGGDSGCSPYFGHGEGTDHFQQQSSAPPCPGACHNPHGYARSLSQDKFNLPRITYQEIWPTTADGNRMAKESMMAHGPLSFGVAASGSGFSGYSSGIIQNGCNPNPNHEVYAFGWGPGYVRGMNSWGSHWGENGGFKLADCSVTDWTIVGDISADVSGLPLPLPGQSGFSESPPSDDPEPSAPAGGGVWSVVSGSCSKDSEGCISSPNYPREYRNRDSCLIRPEPNFGQIEVVDFNTESSYDKLILNGYGLSGSGYNTRPSLHHDLEPTTDIQWTADGSETKTGWKLCPVSRPAAATPAPTPEATLPTPGGESLGGSPWTVVGNCPTSGNCVTSSNYPAEYNVDESCVITAPSTAVTLVDFETESTWDKLELNGNALSGSQGRKGGIMVTSTITWTSDGGNTNRGWKLCA